MNKVYRIVWNTVSHTWVVASEFAKGRKKAGKSSRTAPLRGVVLALSLFGGAATHAGTISTPVQAQNGTYSGTSTTAASATGEDSVAAGAAATASAQGTTAVGAAAKATAQNSTAVGILSNASGNASVALGWQAVGSGTYAVAIGGNANAAGTNSMALGAQASTAVDAKNALAFGTLANASAVDALAIGDRASATQTSAVALGANASATAADSVALGSGSTTTANLGAAAYNPGNAALAGTTPAGEVSLGSSGNERRVTNVAAGAAATDAVNVSQLTSEANKSNALGAATAAALGGGSAYDASTGNLSAPSYTVAGAARNSVGAALTALDSASVQFNGTGGAADVKGNKVVNVANGALNATSTDAVNGSQLNSATRYFKANGANDGTDDASATGTMAVAIGSKAKAAGNSSVALGDGASAAGVSAIAIGTNAAAAGNGNVAIGIGSGTTTATSYNNVSVGIGAGSAVTGGNNYAFGTSAGDNVAGNYNLALGNGAGTGVKSSGTNNVGIGTGAGNLVSGNFNSAVGQGAGVGVTGDNNFAAGLTAGNNVRGVDNVALGLNAGNTVSGNFNSALGQAAGIGVTGDNNAAIGLTAGNNVLGIGNFAAGINAGSGVTATGGYNSAIGASAGTGVSGTYNTAIGQTSGVGVTGNNNVALGLDAGNTVSGNLNSALGSAAGVGVTGDNNAAIGLTAGTGVLGSGNFAAGVNAGSGVTATGLYNSAIGASAGTGVRGTFNTAIGQTAGTGVSGNNNVALGFSAGSGGVASDSNIAIGTLAGSTVASGVLPTISMGYNAQATANYSAAIGYGSLVTQADGTAIGRGSIVSGVVNNTGGGVAIGPVATVLNAGTSVYGNVAIGQASYVTNLGTYSNVALGALSLANNATTGVAAYKPGTAAVSGITPFGEVSVGYAGGERRITNVAAGAALTDAVNVSQLRSAISGVVVGGSDAVQYDSSAHNSVTLGGTASTDGGKTGGAKISNVAQGAVSVTSTDAVNGSQLYATNQSVANVTDTVNTINNGAGIKYFHANSTGADSSATATDAIAVGSDATASAQAAVAIGLGAGATGSNAAAVGANSSASGGTATAIGSFSSAAGTNSLALGAGAMALGSSSKAMGNGAMATGDYAIAMGDSSSSRSNYGTAIGYGAKTGAVGVYTMDDTAVGHGASASGGNAMAMGSSASAYGNRSIAIGTSSSTSSDNAIVVGSASYANGTGAIALGSLTTAGAGGALALGSGAKASQINDVALGAGSVTDVARATPSVTIRGITYDYAGGAPASVVSVGSVGNERQLTNVAAGQVSASSTDAVNGSQLYATNQAIETLTDATGDASQNSVKYDKNGDGTPNYGSVSMAGTPSTDGGVTGGTKISNVAQGAVAAASTDAVNGSQLFATNNRVTTAEGNITNLGNTISNLGDSVSTLANTPITFAGNSGTVAKKLGDTMSIQGAAATAGSYSGANLQTQVDGSGNLQLQMADNLAVTSVTAGNTTVNNTGVTIAGGPSITTGGINGGGQKISNIGTGTADSDAATVGQVTAAANTATADAVKYDDVTHASVTLGNTTSTDGGVTGGTKLTNVAQGQLSTTSTDAVNGAQLNATNNRVTTAEGNITNLGNTISNLGDSVSTLANTPITFAGNSGTVAKKLGDTMSIQGAAATAGSYSGANLQTQVDGSGNLQLQMADNLAVTSVTAGNTTVNNTGVTINGGPSLTTGGINGGGQKISNISAGTADSDAATVGQVTAAANTATADAVKYDDATHVSVTLGGVRATAPVQLGNVAKGAVNATSTDAVNGSQLNDTNNAVSGNTTSINNLAAGAVQYDKNADGTVNTGSVTLAGTGGTKITNVAKGTGDNDAVNVSQLKDSGLIDGSGNTQKAVLFNGPNGEANVAGQKIVNVAAGEVSSTSTDAINGSQLNDTNNAVVGVNKLAAGAVQYDKNADGTVNTGSVTLAGTGGTKITNVAKGTGDNDAVNVSQLKDSGLIDGSGNTQKAVLFNGPNGEANVAGTKIVNVAAGEVSSTSTDAINGSQLHGTADSVANALGGGSTVGTDGKVSAPSYVINKNTDGTGGTTYNNVGDAITNIDGRTTTNTTDISNITNQINNGSMGLVQQAGAGANLTVGKDTDGVAVDFADKDGKTRTLKNVSAGTDDTDAVNVSQLKATGLVDGNGNTLNAVTYDSAAKDSVTLGGVGATSPVKLKNVADGTDDTDAVNVSQLRSAGLVDGNGNMQRAVLFNGPNGEANVVGQKIINVANGAIASGSRDAVNGGQIAALSDSLQGQINGLGNQVTNIDNRVTNIEANGTGGSTSLPYVDGNANGSSGNNANAGSTAGVAVGYNANASGDNASVLGQNATALGSYGTAIGNDSYAAGPNDTALGGNAKVHADGSVAVGANATVTSSAATNAVAVGADTQVSAASGTAIGQGASVTSAATASVALGQGSVADRANTVSVGVAGGERQIANVAAGTQQTDAVNVSQLQGVTSALGGGSTVSSNGSVTAPTYNVAGGSYSNVGDALQGIDSKLNDQFDRMGTAINQVNRDANRGIASAAALVSTTPYLPGKITINAGVAGYRGQSAVGVGVSRWSNDGRVNVNAGVSSSGGAPIVRFGVGLVLGD